MVSDEEARLTARLSSQRVASYSPGWAVAHAYALARGNDGAAGVDGVTFEDVERAGVEAWLEALREDLASMTYRPSPVRRVMIPKPGGGERPLGIRDKLRKSRTKFGWSVDFYVDISMT